MIYVLVCSKFFNGYQITINILYKFKNMWSPLIECRVYAFLLSLIVFVVQMFYVSTNFVCLTCQ